MEDQYPWEPSSSYVPPRRDSLGWYTLIAVILALMAHVFLIVRAGQHFIKIDLTTPKEWGSERIELTSVETDVVAPAEKPEEELTLPEIDIDLVDSVEDAIAELQNIEINVDTSIQDAELPEMKIAQPELKGDEEGELLQPSIGANVNPDLPEPGKIQIDFPETQRGGLLVADDGAPLADIIDPKATITELAKMQGVHGEDVERVIDGYTGLEAYANMSPGELQQNKASIGSDLLFDFDQSVLRDDARLTLMTVAMLIDRNPSMYCWVEGHTDLIGGDDYNMKLSTQRGEAVKSWLVQALQLDGSRIFVRPFGKTQPIVSDGDRQKQAVNRRVDIKMRKTRPDSQDQPVKMLVRPGRAIRVQDGIDSTSALEQTDENREVPRAEVVVPQAQRIPGVEIPQAIRIEEEQ